MRAKKNRFFHCFKPLKLMIGLVVLCGYVECCCVAYGQQDVYDGCKVDRANNVQNKDDLFDVAKNKYSKTDDKYILPLSYTEKGFSYAICDESCYGYHVFSAAEADGYDYVSSCLSDGWASYKASTGETSNNVVRINFGIRDEVCVKDFVIMSPNIFERLYSDSAYANDKIIQLSNTSSTKISNANVARWAASNQLSIKPVVFDPNVQRSCREASLIVGNANIISIESRLESLEQNAKQSKGACSQEFLNGAQAAEGEVMSNGKCAATKCLKDRYLVVNSSGNSQGVLYS